MIRFQPGYRMAAPFRSFAAVSVVGHAAVLPVVRSVRDRFSPRSIRNIHRPLYVIGSCSRQVCTLPHQLDSQFHHSVNRRRTL
ncbi:hypothetical protein NSPZN2_160075 [Nitrospira defluvii]|uniref:Secreted protein n=1 Tax=Nitrospira defluvii TaxID=330214 RepID=A0ABM8RBZ3_9BACT|nr:hypothetical protein NSPZN2_160075 [Nitrospira defluvii]